MATKDSINLRHLINTFRILNMSDVESSVSEEKFPFQNVFRSTSYIVSDVDEQMLLLVEFHDFVDLHSIKIYAIPADDNKTNADDEDEDDDDDEEDEVDDEEPSAPKEVSIFKVDNLSFDFNDVEDRKPDHSVNCSVKKLSKGQLVNLKKKSKIALKFKKIKYLVLLVKSNQKQTEKTFLSGIILNGQTDAKLAYDIPYTAVSSKKKQKFTEIVAMFDKLDKSKVGLAKLLKMNQSRLDFTIANDTVHSLLSYISRLPQQLNRATVHRIFVNDNKFGSQWLANTLQFSEECKMNDGNTVLTKFKVEKPARLQGQTQTEQKQASGDDDVDYAEKMSYALMKIFCDEDRSKEMQLFLDKKMDFLIFHCMLVFHPSSRGNMYHSVEILKILLQADPVKLYSVLTNSSSYPVISQLFKYALLTRIHEAKFGEFLLALLLHSDTKITELRSTLIGNLREWHFLETMIEIASHPQVYGEDTANKYCEVIAILCKQCASMKETAVLFGSNATHQNILSLIVEQFTKGALDKERNHKWHRIHCLEMVIQTINDLCDTKVVEKKRKKIIKSSDNHLYSYFDDTLKKLRQYVPLIAAQIIDDNDAQRTHENNTHCKPRSNIKRPLGLFRLKCLQLLMLYMELMLNKKSNNFESLHITNIEALCARLADMAFVHVNNNLFLVQFRHFLNVLDKTAVQYLRYMMVDCNMLKRFMEHYQQHSEPTALKSFILSILWDLNKSSIGKADKMWNFNLYLESDIDAKQFMQVVQEQISLQQQQQKV